MRLFQKRWFWGAVLLAMVCLFIASMIRQQNRSYIDAYQQHLNRPIPATTQEARDDMEFSRRIRQRWD